MAGHLINGGHELYLYSIPSVRAREPAQLFSEGKLLTPVV
jgi:hypothetical protein